jgi:alginate O-acetyltransferase complex protein AlgI
LRLNRAPRLMDAARVLFTFHLVTLAWVFFRAPTIHDACYILTHLFRDVSLTFSGHDVGPPEDVALALGAIAAVVVAEWAHARHGLGEWLVTQSRPLRWASYYAGVLALVFLGSFDAQPFIYFQF